MGIVLVIVVIFEFVAPKEDQTVYRQTSGKSEFKHEEKKTQIKEDLRKLLAAGKSQVEANKMIEAAQNRKRFVIKYAAPQIIGENERSRPMIRSGSKLIGILKNPIDTRVPSLVRVLITRGGESAGIEIETGSVLVGQYSYMGDGDRVLITFSRIDPPDNREPKKISAVGLDAGNFTAGIQGEEFTGQGIKVATRIGLSMFSGIADTLTERESLGNSFNGTVAKPTMKNALLQGLSKTAQEQADLSKSKIDQERNYVFVPEGKEMIIELLEDYK